MLSQASAVTWTVVIAASAVVPLVATFVECKRICYPASITEARARLLAAGVIFLDVVVSGLTVLMVYLGQRTLPINFTADVLDRSDRLQAVTIYGGLVAAVLVVSGLGRRLSRTLLGRRQRPARGPKISNLVKGAGARLRVSGRASFAVRAAMVEVMRSRRTAWVNRFFDDAHDSLSAWSLDDLVEAVKHHLLNLAVDGQMLARSTGPDVRDYVLAPEMLSDIDTLANDKKKSKEARKLSLLRLLFANYARGEVERLLAKPRPRSSGTN